MIFASVAQSAEATDLKSVKCGFESRHSYYAPVTQWIEYRISNPAVAGSSPARRV